MQRYAKVPDFIVLSEDQQLITLWSVIYLSEVSRQRHDHQKNMRKYSMNRSRYFRLLKRVRDYINEETRARSPGTQARLRRDSSRTRLRLQRDSIETPTVQTNPDISESVIPDWDSSETIVRLDQDSSDTIVRLGQDSTPVQVRRDGVHVGLYKNKDNNKDHDISFQEPILKSDREIYEMTTEERIRYIRLNEQRLKQAGRI